MIGSLEAAGRYRIMHSRRTEQPPKIISSIARIRPATFGDQHLLWRMASVIALLTALGGVLSACGFSNTFNYGDGHGACLHCGGSF
jgi:hypothetical protein